MPHAFISYSRDDEDKAFALDSRLKSAGIETFVDDVVLRAGDEWRDTLQGALDSAFAVIVVCTQSSVASHEVSFEWAYAMGQGIPVIPLIYEPNCPLHTRLQVLQYLDFSNPRKRPWHRLVNLLLEARSKYRPTIAFLRTVGIERIALSRDELKPEHTISGILEKAKAGSELLVVARSCEAWARQYLHLQNAVNTRSLHIKLAMVNPSTPKEQWMIRSDYAQLDVEATLGKLRLIELEPKLKGSIELYWLPSSPLFSFVHFVNQDNHQIGILEAGASLPLNERTAIILRSGGPTEGIMLKRLYKIYSRVLDGIAPAFIVKPRQGAQAPDSATRETNADG